MHVARIRLLLSAILVFGTLFVGCGGGGGGGSSGAPSPSGVGATLEWDPPMMADDGTPMDPRVDIDYYEFFLRTDTNFTESDLPVAQVTAFFDVTELNGMSFRRKLTQEFALDNLLPFTETGKRYYISIRAVGLDGLKSGFMVPVEWDLT